VRPQPKFTPSRALVEATYQLLVADKAMVGLLLAGGFAAAAVLALVMYPAWPFGHIATSASSTRSCRRSDAKRHRIPSMPATMTRGTGITSATRSAC
jgi:hypothetical protein